MTMTSEDLMKAMDFARFDPAAKALDVLDAVDDNLAGNYRLVDPTSPFMLMWEYAAACGAHVLNGIDVLNRKRYPGLALTMEDLHLHMTDRDFLNVFNKPPVLPITLLVSRDEVIRYAVEVTAGGMKKLVMPKNSNFTCNGYTFTAEYPIEFRIPPVGEPTVVYGTPLNGVLNPSNGNLLEVDQVAGSDGVPMLRLLANMSQMAINSQVYPLNQATVWNTRIAFNDLYSYCRAYVRARDAAGVPYWKEIKVNYTRQVFDPYDPTVLVRLYDKVIDCYLPQIYQTTGQVTGELRIDVYTTKGVNDMVFEGFSANDWSEEWLDLDSEDQGKYTANWGLLSTYSVYSDQYTTGGKPALTLEELRNRVMQHNTGEINIPITPVNLDFVLGDMDYTSVKDVDAITKRTLNATRVMESPQDKYTITPISGAVENLIVRMADLNGIPGVSHNTDSVTIHPSVLFRSVDGGMTIVSQSEINDLYQLKPEAMARAVSSAGYRFSPFHWVLDAANESFEVRAYYLDAPTIEGRQFWMENPSLQLDLQAAQTFTVSRTEKGYLIHLLTKSGDLYKDLEDYQLHVQLAYTPPGESAKAYLNGTLIAKQDGDRVYEFLLETNYAINANDAMTLRNFSMFGDGPLDHLINLSVTFDVIYTVSDYTVVDMKEGDIDNDKNRNMLPYDSVGILQERVQVKLGSPLKYLWAGSRSITTEADYQVYDDDVPELYTEPVFEMDPNNPSMMKVDVVNGKVVTYLLHQVGEPVIKNGVQQYRKFKGDFVLDANGNKILVSPRQLARQIDLTLFDGRYYFANDKSTEDYLKLVCTKMLQWSDTDMGNTNKTVLEKTKLYLKPIATNGKVRCVVESGSSVVLDAEQSPKVQVYMTEAGWNNEVLKSGIRTTIIQQLATDFAKDRIEALETAEAIKKNAGSEVITVRVSNLGGDKNYPLISMADNSGRLSVRKKLTALPDGTFTVEEDVDVQFLKHLPALADK
jgi:hypothetical protein